MVSEKCGLAWADCAQRPTYGFFDLAKLLEFLTQGLVVGMPCKASVGRCQSVAGAPKGRGRTYPMKSFDMM
ncbi:hypothetical protein IAQ61_004259 [Plenodomus lingam]|uniref:uncharacterized protein n=1 Tax=Leptosphaeria maculans TaxID=5022 RepID=UPI0033188308|nr:hypothetical protein IAQ61_004259 [Plenodomus lingam]